MFNWSNYHRKSELAEIKTGKDMLDIKLKITKYDQFTINKHLFLSALKGVTGNVWSALRSNSVTIHRGNVSYVSNES